MLARTHALTPSRARARARRGPPGISDIDELVAAFAAGEDANLTLFNYVTEVDMAGGGGGCGDRMRGGQFGRWLGEVPS